MRIKHIDILRGIAAIIVTVFHLAKSSGMSHDTFDYAKFGFVGVQIFFVISGFILPYSLHKTNYQLKDFGIFILKRVVRIYPAYIAAIVIGVALALITGREQIPGIAVVSHLFFLNDILGLPSGSVVFWTLAIEFQFYVLIGLMFTHFLSSNIRSVFLVLGLAFVSIIIPQSSFIFYWFPFFGIGIMAFNRKFSHLSPFLFWFVIGTLLIIAVIKHGFPQAIASLFAVGFILYGSFSKETLIRRGLVFLGTISYSLYLIHWDLGRAAVRASRHFPVIGNIGLLRVSIGVAFSIFCAWLLYILIEKKSALLSGKIKYKKLKGSF